MEIARTGQLNNRITFNEKKTTKVNGVAKTINEEVATVWAEFRSQSVKDRIANMGNGVSNAVTFIIRDQQSFDITNDMTISYGGLTYEIKDVNHDFQQGKWKTIICEVIKG